MSKIKSTLDRFCRAARKFGAKDAKVISAKTIFTAPWVRLKCQFGCGGYGRCLTCPPYSPEPEQTRKVIDSYKKAVLVHVDSDDWKDIKKIVLKLETEVFFAGYYRALAFGAGPCNLCRRCNLEKCVNPEDARPSMEACGIDVFKTARKNGFKIEVVKNTRDRANYFGVVLVE